MKKEEQGGFTKLNQKTDNNEGLHFATHCAFSGEELSEPIRCLPGEFVIKSKYRQKIFGNRDRLGFPYCRKEIKDFLKG